MIQMGMAVNRLYSASLAVIAVVAAVSSPASVQADPGSDPAPAESVIDPFPDIRYYDAVDPSAYIRPGGVWFVAPGGQNCGIWGRGNFGCTGDIPGAPDSVRHIGWINGDRAVHYDWSMAVRFPATRAEKPLPPHGKITHEGTTCAATVDRRAYCERGPLRFVMEPSKTWLSAAWMDLSWMERGPASCAPPGGGPCYS